MPDQPDASPAAHGPLTRTIKQLFLFFALAYFAQGISQDKSGMLGQCLKFYYTKHEHMASTAIADFSAPLMLPWVIKPVYGLITDLLPLGRYRRKSYLVLTCLLAIAGFAVVLFADSRWVVRGAIFLTSLGIAFGDVLVDALMVENGQRTGYLRLFQGVQWQWISVAGVLAAFVGGQLSEHLGPVTAVRTAAVIAMVPMAALLAAALFFVQEEPSRDSRAEAIRSLAGLKEALISKTLWKMALILFLINFAPNTGTAWYVFATEKLKLSQQSVSFIDAAGSLAGFVGAFLFNKLAAERMTQRRLLLVAIFVSAGGFLPFALVGSLKSAFVAAVLGGVAGLFAQVALLSLAGEACPKRAEAFTFALLMSVLNQAYQWGDQIGARIFDAVHQELWPLVLFSVGTTLLALVLVPLLPDRPLEAPEPAG